MRCLKHSEDFDGNEFNACDLDPIRMVGVNAEAFDADFWNEHLDFDDDEWRVPELDGAESSARASDEKHVSDEEDLSSGDEEQPTVSVGIRRIVDRTTGESEVSV